MPTMRLEHQESINRFSRLNTEKKLLEARKKALERTVEDAEEAGNEVMLADEETGMLCAHCRSTNGNASECRHVWRSVASDTLDDLEGVAVLHCGPFRLYMCIEI